MSQKSRRSGQVTLTFKNDERYRHSLVLSRRKEGFDRLTRSQVDAEVNELACFFKSRSPKNLGVDLAKKLEEAYEAVLDEGCPATDECGVVINLELVLLRRLVVDEGPASLREMILRRLEDFYVQVDGRGFFINGKLPIEKLEAMGELLLRKKLLVPWRELPLMESLMVPSLALERGLDNGEHAMSAWITKLRDS